MVNHPNRRRAYKVQTLHGASDTPRACHFEVMGPRMDEFAERDRVAAVMQQALNAPDDDLRAILRAILDADERGQGQPFAEAMDRARAALRSQST